MTLIAFEDPNHDGNSTRYHTGETCIEKGCKQPAGTWWSPHWCFEHNVARMRRITAGLEDAVRRAEVAAMVDKATADLRSVFAKYCGIVNAMVAASGGTLTIKTGDIDRDYSHQSVQYHENGTQTWKVTLE